MPVHFAARLHAFVLGLFQIGDRPQTMALHRKVKRLFRRNELVTSGEQVILLTNITADVMEALGQSNDNAQADVVYSLLQRLFEFEEMFVLPDIDWWEPHSVSEYWTIRDKLAEQRALVVDLPATQDLITKATVAWFKPIYDAAPALLAGAKDTDGITINTTLVDSLADPGETTEQVFRAVFAEKLRVAGLFPRLRDRLERSLIAASGGNPADPAKFNRTPRFPSRFEVKYPAEVLETYLGGTPLLPPFNQSVRFIIPTRTRFEHHHIVAGSGHGKTQTLQYLIGQDIAAMEHEQRSLIVLDSQGDLIRNISNLAVFGPEGTLRDRIVIIDPTDVEWPVSLNLFDVGQDRLAGYEPLERERLTNSILELYDFVLGTLLDAQMTQKQNVIFRYVTRLMLHIPDATIHTLRELMEPDSQVKFAGDIAKLSGTARHFFETEFASREFAQTKQQVLRRLWGILENQTFERMFSHPRSKLDLFAEMNAGKVILINTAKDLLKETGTEIFGRFFIAMIAQAAQERASLPGNQRTPTMVYIDEAADYFDRNIGIILAQARKYNVGMVLAHQYLGQLKSGLDEALSANTSIKFAGGVSAKDARTLAPMLYCDPRFIEAQPKGSFAAYLRGVTPTALPLAFPFGFLEGQLRMSRDERRDLQTAMRDRYAVHYTELSGVATATSDPVEVEKVDEKTDAPEPSNPSTDATSEL